MDGLAGAGHVPVLVDLPGHGRHAGQTGEAAFTLDAALDQVASAGSWPCDLLGYSMGGRIALHFAVRYPHRVDRLVLESASPGLASEEERSARRDADAELAERILANGIEWFVEEWESRPLFESQRRLASSDREAPRERRLANAPGSLAAALLGLGTGRLPSLWEALGEVHVPVLLLVGEKDRKFVEIARRMSTALPHAQVAVVPDAGHSVHFERPDAWVEAVVGFISDR